MQNFKHLSLYNIKTRNIFKFSRVNLLFGYSFSGKTFSLERLKNIFNGKSKDTLVNGTEVISDEYNVFFLQTNDSITSHLKVSSKSLLKQLLLNLDFVKDLHNKYTNIYVELQNLKITLQNELSKFLPNISVDIDEKNDCLDFFLQNIEFSLISESTTKTKEDLFELIFAITKITNKQAIVLIDDFNNSFDEEDTIKFLTQIGKSNAYYFLTTKKPIPQFLLNLDFLSIFALRNNTLYPIPNIESLIIDSLDLKEENYSFEEYMLNSGYIKNSIDLKRNIQNLLTDASCNVQRILTAKNPIITDTLVSGKVCLIYKNEFEFKLFNHIFELINIK